MVVARMADDNVLRMTWATRAPCPKQLPPDVTDKRTCGLKANNRMFSVAGKLDGTEIIMLFVPGAMVLFIKIRAFSESVASIAFHN